jgi:signal transduction histidine kinase
VGVIRRHSIDLRVLVVVLVAGLAAGAVALYVATQAMTDLAEVGLVGRTTERTDRARQMIADRLAVARAQLTAAALLAQVDRSADVPTALSEFIHAARVERDGESLELVRDERARRPLAEVALGGGAGARPGLVADYVAVPVEVGAAAVVGLIEVASLLPRGPGQLTRLEAADDPRLAVARVIVTRQHTARGELAIANAALGDGLRLHHEASLAGARAEVNAAMRRVVGWTIAITAVVVIILAWALTRRVTRPLRALAHALRARHDGALVLPPLQDDEIGELGAAIAAMHARLAHDARLMAVSAELARDVATVQDEAQVLELLAAALARAHPEHGWQVLDAAAAAATLAATAPALAPPPHRAPSSGFAAPVLHIAGDRLLVPLGDGGEAGLVVGHGPITDVDRESVEVLCRTSAAAMWTLDLVAAAILNDKLALIGRMSASVAHEMNNPLAYVTVNLGLLEEQITGPGRELVRDAQAGVERLTRIVSDLSRASRGDADQTTTEELGALVGDEVRIAQGAERRHRDADDRAEPTAVGPVRTPPGSAGGAQPPGQRPRRRRLHPRRRTGRGVAPTRRRPRRDRGPRQRPRDPPAARRRLFDAFFTTKGQRGTGLGLYLSRQFVERQGGSLELLATDATGTTFELRLPLAPAPPRSSTRPRRRRPSGARAARQRVAPRPRPRVLIIDDEAPIVRTLTGPWPATPTSPRCRRSPTGWPSPTPSPSR